MSWPREKLLGFDLESTGIDPTTALPVSFALVSFELGEVDKRRYGLVNPGIPIPPETTKIHGVTDAMVKERGGDLQRTIDGIAEILVDAAEEGTPLVGANLRYDLTVLDTCHRRFHNAAGLRDLGWNGLVIDVMVIDRHLDKFRKGSRKLAALCELYGVDPGASHNAVSDAEAAVRVALALAKKHEWLSHLSVEELHVYQCAWRREWVVGYNEYRAKKEQEPIPESEGDWPLLGDTEVTVLKYESRATNDGEGEF